MSREELEIAYAIEGLTNDRLRVQAGDLYRLPRAQWVTGPGASVVMAPFTHVGRASRFSDGRHGVYYAALDEDTAIAETAFHVARFLRQTREPPIEVDQRLYVGGILEPLDDIRGAAFATSAQPGPRHLARLPGFRRGAPRNRRRGTAVPQCPTRGR